MSCGGVYELHPPTHTVTPMETEFNDTPPWRCMAKPHCSEACVRGRCGGAGGNDDPSWSPVWLFPFPMKGNSSSSFFIFIFFGVLHKCGRHLLFANSILLLFTKKERRQMSLIPFQPSPYFSLSCCLVSITHLL